MAQAMPDAVGREQLLLDAADRQHLAAQRDLAGHRHVAPHRDAGERRHERRAHRDARGGPVLRNRTLGHVDVDVDLAAEVARDPELLCARAHEGHRRVGGLLHHVAQLAGEPQRPLARHQRHLDRQDLAADLGPGEPGGDADLVVLLLLRGA